MRIQFIMKGFIIKIALFLVIGSVIIVAAITIPNYILSNNQRNYKLSPCVDKLFLGHSHPECAYNEQYLINIKNLGSSGESYFYSYLKAKQIVKANPQIKLVLLEFSNNQIDAKMDAWIWDDIHLNAKFSKFSAFAGNEDTRLLASNNLKGYLQALSSGTRKNIGLCLDAPENIIKTKNWGGYRALEVNNISNKLTRKHTSTVIKSSNVNTKVSEMNLFYLKKLIDFLENNGVDVFLLRTPVHLSYPYLNNEIQFDSILKRDFKNLPFLDFQRYPLYNSQFANDSHLNVKGANELSKALQSLIDSGLLQHATPQEAIDKVVDSLRKLREPFFIPEQGYVNSEI